VNRRIMTVVVQVMSITTARIALRLAGAALLVATAAIHLDLYLTGYRTIPTIGPLFLLQIIAGFGLGAAVLAIGGWLNRLVALAAALFVLSTLGGYLLSLQFGLFGFREVRTTAGVVAGIIEIAAFAALAALALLPAAEHAPAQRPATLDSARMSRSDARAGSRPSLAGWMRGDAVPATLAVPAVAAVSVLAFGLMGGALAGAGSSGGGSGPSATAAGGAMLKTGSVGRVTVLTNAQGRTLYWFAPDTSSKSACYGSCAQYWPPVSGPDKAGPGVTGTLATISRTGGSLQETYDGHPLYTYVGDTAPGQANGNNLNLNGGLWHEVVVH
jgi:predicted lipoprotein with Yx(FWY)xxD motif